MEGEYDWFFDTLIQYIKGPRWRVPVLSFIEENCIVFDGGEENQLEHKSIHNEFCKIVDGLLCDIMAELGIDQETFMDACNKAATPVHKKVVQQILSVDDFLTFKQIMVKKNQTLEDQAMTIVLKKEEEGKQRSLEEYGAEGDSGDEELRQQMALAMQLSEEQAKNTAELERLEEEKMMAQALEMSKQDERRRQTEVKDRELAMIRQQNEIKKQEIEQKIQMQAQEEIKHEQEVEEIKQEEIKLEQEVAKIEQELQQIRSSQDARVKSKEEAKLRELAELRKRQKEGKSGNQAKPEFVRAKPQEPAPQQKALPDVSNRKGGFFENEQLKQQQKKLLNQLQSSEGDEVSSFGIDKPVDPNAGLSFAEALKKKREALEKEIENKQKNNESKPLTEAEQRKQRLQAQRDALVKKNQQKRELELKQHYKENPGIMQSTFYKKMMALDNNIKEKEGKNKQQSSQQASQSVIKKAEESKQEEAKQSSNDDGFLSNIKAVKID